MNQEFFEKIDRKTERMGFEPMSLVSSKIARFSVGYLQPLSHRSNDSLNKIRPDSTFPVGRCPIESATESLSCLARRPNLTPRFYRSRRHKQMNKKGSPAVIGPGLGLIDRLLQAISGRPTTSGLPAGWPGGCLRPRCRAAGTLGGVRGSSARTSDRPARRQRPAPRCRGPRTRGD